MQIIINVLAGIGFLTMLGFIWVACELFKSAREEKKKLEKPPYTWSAHKCPIIKDECTRPWCTGCLAKEEEEKRRWAKK